MNVTDPQRARAASTLIVAGLAAGLGISVLSYIVNWVVPGSFEGPWPIVQQLLWLGATGVLIGGLLQLAGVATDGTVLKLAVAMVIFDALVDLGLTISMHVVEGGFGALPVVLYDASLLLSVVTRGVLIVAIVQLTMKTHAWVLPLLGTVALLMVARAVLSVALQHDLVSHELYRSPFYRLGTVAIGLFNSGAMLIGGLALKSAVPTTPGLGTPALVAAAGLRPAEPEPISPVSDFLVGGILLVVGIGVTVVSMQAASAGGRYIVATGAIGVGLGRIIRGFIRLARG